MERKIVCAANKHTSKFTGCDVLLLGVRHWDDYMRAQCEIYSIKNQDYIQGFIDNKGDFHTRKKAYLIAKAAGQIVRKEGEYDGDELFSEDLY